MTEVTSCGNTLTGVELCVFNFHVCFSLVTAVVKCVHLCNTYEGYLSFKFTPLSASHVAEKS